MTECPDTRNEQQKCPFSDPSGISAVHGRKDPVVWLERLCGFDGSVCQSRRKRRRRSAESGEEGDTTGSPRGGKAAGTTGDCKPNGNSTGSRKRSKPAVGTTSTCSELTSSGCVDRLSCAQTPATSSSWADGLSFAQTPTQDGGSVDGLSSARTPAASSVGGSIEGNGGSVHGGCVDRLSYTQTPAVDSGVHGLPHVHSPTVSHTVENDSCATGFSNEQIAVWTTQQMVVGMGWYAPRHLPSTVVCCRMPRHLL